MKNYDNRMYITCEICEEKPASDIKGGIYDNKRNLWFVCKDCKEKIDDTRSMHEPLP